VNWQAARLAPPELDSREAIDLGPPSPEVSEVVTAMIVVSLRYTDVAETVASQLRHQRAAT
jgi:hypothetical protein